MSEQIRVPKGLYGVAVTETSIAKSNSEGELVYRGYDINELAAYASFEETAYLILYGRLPKINELDRFVSSIRANMKLDERIIALIRLLPKDSHPMDVIRTVVSALPMFERRESIKDAQISIAAKIGFLVANCDRLLDGKDVIKPRDDLSYSENMLYIITGKVPSKEDAWIFERVLILYIEHDLNASSFTVRVVASTLADPYSAITSGLAALKGPLHGGANEGAMQMLLDLGDPSKVKDYIDRELKEGRKIVGFGHRIYKKYDPRAQLCKMYLKDLIERKGLDKTLFRLCESIENEMWERKRIPANLDFYAAPIFYTLGIPIRLFTPIFAASRVFGWIAHYNEQIEDNKIIRPDAIYTGPKGLRYTNISER